MGEFRLDEALQGTPEYESAYKQAMDGSGAAGNPTHDCANDPLTYLSDRVPQPDPEEGIPLSPTERREHYRAIRRGLARLYTADRATFAVAAEQVKEKLGIGRKDLEADLKPLLDSIADPPAAKEARELLERMGQTCQLHLAQDFVDGKLWYGVIAGGDKLLLNSDRELLTLDKVPEGLTVKDSGFDLCRLSKEAILRFLSGETAAGAELLTDLRDFFTRFAVFRDQRLSLLLAAWTLGTYAYTAFRVYPYLVLRSPLMRCGKSRVLDLLSLLAFNASKRVTHPTVAQIFRGPARNGGTLLLDEVEALGKADQEAYAGLLAVLNSGFEQGGSVSRMEKTGVGNFQEVSFETYCPRALAGIRKLADTLEDRGIPFLMQRKLKREKTARFSPSSAKLQAEAQALRDRCYLWALTHAADLGVTYDQADHFFAPYLGALDDRAQDLWEPLVSIVALADGERGDGQKALTDELTALARDLCQVRAGAAEDSATVQLIQALQRIVAEKRQESPGQAQAEITLAPEDLVLLLKEKLRWEKLSAKGLAALLHPLGLFSKQTRQGNAVGRAYHLIEEDLAELSERYAQPEAKEDEKK